MLTDAMVMVIKRTHRLHSQQPYRHDSVVYAERQEITDGGQ
ncbi:hypothetical protein Pvag_pPag10144 (plasmid) [Pantoea vagans C9-1]|nr:hypothetical protein Pvag_pPag10144 [Pantoea vagans C9-1]